MTSKQWGLTKTYRIVQFAPSIRKDDYLTTKQTAFLKAMLEESTIKKAAEKAGISRDTAYKYLKNENFQAELNKRRSECVTDTVRFLQSKLSLCSETLVSIVENPETGAQIKINAINAIFANCKALLETTEILQKMAELEAEQENINEMLESVNR